MVYIPCDINTDDYFERGGDNIEDPGPKPRFCSKSPLPSLAELIGNTGKLPPGMFFALRGYRKL